MLSAGPANHAMPFSVGRLAVLPDNGLRHRGCDPLSTPEGRGSRARLRCPRQRSSAKPETANCCRSSSAPSTVPSLNLSIQPRSIGHLLLLHICRYLGHFMNTIHSVYLRPLSPNPSRPLSLAILRLCRRPKRGHLTFHRRLSIFTGIY
jgi:hypothetical protein